MFLKQRAGMQKIKKNASEIKRSTTLILGLIIAVTHTA